LILLSIVGGLHREGEWNEVHKVVDHDSSDGTAT